MAGDEAVKLILPGGEVRRITVRGGLRSLRQLRMVLSRVDGLAAAVHGPPGGAAVADAVSPRLPLAYRDPDGAVAFDLDSDQALESAVAAARVRGTTLRLLVGVHALPDDCKAPEPEAPPEPEYKAEHSDGRRHLADTAAGQREDDGSAEGGGRGGWETGGGLEADGGRRADLSESGVLQARPEAFAARLQEASRRHAARLARSYDEFYQSLADDASARLSVLETRAREASTDAERREAERELHAEEAALARSENALLADFEEHMQGVPPPRNLMPVSVVLRLPVGGASPIEVRLDLRFTSTVGDLRRMAAGLASTLDLPLDVRRASLMLHRLVPPGPRPEPQPEPQPEPPRDGPRKPAARGRRRGRRPRSNSDGGLGGVLKGMLDGLGAVLGTKRVPDSARARGSVSPESRAGREGDEGQAAAAAPAPAPAAVLGPPELLSSDSATVAVLAVPADSVITVVPAEPQEPGRERAPAPAGGAAPALPQAGPREPPSPPSRISPSVMAASSITLVEERAPRCVPPAAVTEAEGEDDAGQDEGEDGEEAAREGGVPLFEAESKENAAVAAAAAAAAAADKGPECKEEEGTRPRTAYEIYVETKAPLLQKEIPSMSDSDVLAAVASMWRTLSDDMQRHYKDLAACEAVTALDESGCCSNDGDGEARFGRDSAWEAL